MNEFARAWQVATIGAKTTVTLAAGPAERAALARRFGLVAIARLDAEALLDGDGAGIAATGRMRAEVTQACAITGEPVAAALDEAFTLRFVPLGQTPKGDEIELSAADLDVIEYEGDSIDLGEAIAVTLALALDPFPRAPGAEEVLKDAGVLREGEEAVGPFAALAALRKT